MWTDVVLKVGLIAIDTLIKKESERQEIKKRLIEATARYNERVLDSVLIRREWDDLKRAFDDKT